MRNIIGTRRVSVATLGLLAAIFLLATAAMAQRVLATSAEAQKKEKEDPWVERFTTSAVGGGHQGAAAGIAARIDFIVERWTTSEERAEILKLLATNDGRQITKGLGKLDTVGRIRIPGERGYDLRYAYEWKSEGKRTIVLASDRPLASTDMMHTPDIDYLVALIVFEVDDTGRGTGYIQPAIELEMTPAGDLKPKLSAADPIPLTDVRKD